MTEPSDLGAPARVGSSSVQHTVTFQLKESVDPAWFLDECQKLSLLPGVVDFEVLFQVGLKNEFTHGLSMYFADAAAYEAYDAHPDHRAFVDQVWLPNVARFLELDYRRNGQGS